jgi:predicted alpha/beta superfamily hydrolase
MLVVVLGAADCTVAAAQNKNSRAATKPLMADTVKFQLDMRKPLADKRFVPQQDTVGVRGGIPPLEWGASIAASDPDGDGIYTAVVVFKRRVMPGRTVFFGDQRIPYKFKISSPYPKQNDGWEQGDNSALVLSGTGSQTAQRAFGVAEQAPLMHTTTGKIIIHENVPTKNLVPRNVIVYLPPGYDGSTGKTGAKLNAASGEKIGKKANLKASLKASTTDTTMHYPVLYMHDGQNLFDDFTASGTEWHLDEIAEALISRGEIKPVIIVGIYNTPDQGRINEYTPSATLRSVGFGKSVMVGGQGAAFGKMLIEEIKPFIDKTYRTLPDAANTSLGGSSLGGLSTLHHGLLRPDVFSGLLVVSPSLWWDNRFAINQLNALKTKPKHRVWIDMGTNEGAEALEDLRTIKQSFIASGYQLGKDWNYLEDIGGRHDEATWSARAEPMLRFLYGLK